MLNAIFSDIHSNLQAYQAFIEDCKKEKIEKYYCAGDIVGYGANPKECIKITQQLTSAIVAGNHDWSVGGKLGIEYFNDYAKEAVLWTKQVLDDTDINYLSSLPLIYEEKDIALVHGSLVSPQDFNYVSDAESVSANFRFQKTKLCFIGHSHRPDVFFKFKNGRIEYTSQPQIKIEKGAFYLINVGSIGQPRDRNYKGSYCIYDDEKNTLFFKRIEYDVRAAAASIINAGLPLYFAYRIERGM